MFSIGRYAASFFTCPCSQCKQNVGDAERRVPYAVSLVSGCNRPASNVLKVIVSSLAQRSTLTADNTVTFTVCMSVLHSNHSDYQQLVETIEMNRLFGAERFVFYNMSSSSDVQLVLDSYSRDGILDVIPWHSLPMSSRDENKLDGGLAPLEVHYFGQVAALNDCLYRNMRRSTFVLVSDADELVVSRDVTSGLSWNAMLESATRDWLSDRRNAELFPGVYMIRQTFFRVGWPLPAKHKTNLAEWLTAPTNSSLVINAIKREHHIYPYGIRSKYFIRSRAAVMLGIHFPFKTLTSSVRTVRVNASTGLLHHYRMKSVNGKKRKFIYDTWMKQFSTDLVQRLNSRRKAITELQNHPQNFNSNVLLRIFYQWLW